MQPSLLVNAVSPFLLTLYLGNKLIKYIFKINMTYLIYFKIIKEMRRKWLTTPNFMLCNNFCLVHVYRISILFLS